MQMGEEFYAMCRPPVQARRLPAGGCADAIAGGGRTGAAADGGRCEGRGRGARLGLRHPPYPGPTIPARHQDLPCPQTVPLLTAAERHVIICSYQKIEWCRFRWMAFRVWLLRMRRWCTRRASALFAFVVHLLDYAAPYRYCAAP